MRGLISKIYVLALISLLIGFGISSFVSCEIIECGQDAVIDASSEGVNGVPDRFDFLLTGELPLEPGFKSPEDQVRALMSVVEPLLKLPSGESLTDEDMKQLVRIGMRCLQPEDQAYYIGCLACQADSKGNTTRAIGLRQLGVPEFVQRFENFESYRHVVEKLKQQNLTEEMLNKLETEIESIIESEYEELVRIGRIVLACPHFLYQGL